MPCCIWSQVRELPWVSGVLAFPATDSRGRCPATWDLEIWLGGPPAIVRRLYLFVFLGPGPMLGGGGGHWELSSICQRGAEAGV